MSLQRTRDALSQAGIDLDARMQLARVHGREHEREFFAAADLLTRAADACTLVNDALETATSELISIAGEARSRFTGAARKVRGSQVTASKIRQRVANAVDAVMRAQYAVLSSASFARVEDKFGIVA